MGADCHASHFISRSRMLNQLRGRQGGGQPVLSWNQNRELGSKPKSLAFLGSQGP